MPIDFRSYIQKGRRRGDMTLKQGVINSSQRGLTNGWTRNTFILRKNYLEKIKALAYWERKKIKDVVDEALGSYLKGKKIRVERIHGEGKMR